MSMERSSARRRDGRLWGIALGLSLLLNGLFLVLLGLAAVHPVFQTFRPVATAPPPPRENIITILPSAPTPPAPAVEATKEPRTRMARTSADQEADRPEKPSFIGERNTRATSDRSPDASQPPMPSQAGIDPKNPDHFETTESDYQDGKLTDAPSRPSPPAQPAAATPRPDPTAAAESRAGESTPTPGQDSMASSSPPRPRLAEGPNPVEIPVPRETPQTAPPKETPPQRPREGDKNSAAKASDAPKPKAAPAPDPAFRGYQRKTAIQGSITRNGRSALDVADSPLGRYQAQISRAVELEWRRNCVRHRDFITPGFLTVRFFVEASGRVRTVQFVGEMETGEVQKGFTLNSIRDAAIPPMPPALKKDYEKEPLELIFNFYF